MWGKKMNNILKRGMLFIMINLLVTTGHLQIVQGDMAIDNQKQEIFTESNSTLLHLFCGKIHNLTKYENFSLYIFYSDNMREFFYAKGSDGSWMMWYIRSRSEEFYGLSSSDFRGILTQRFIFGYTIDYDK